MSDLTHNLNSPPHDGPVEPQVRLLVIEDEADFAELVCAMFDGSEFACHRVGTLGEGLAALATGEFHLALTDLGLPDSDGGRSWKAIRSQFPDLPLIVVTGVNDEKTAEEALKGGAQDYIRKIDVTSDLLLRTARYAISRQESLRQTQRARDEAAALAERQSALARIARLVSSTEDLSSVYDEIASELRKTMRFGRLALHLVDWEAGTFSVRLISGEPHENDKPGRVQPLKGSRTEAATLRDDVTVLDRATIERDAEVKDNSRWTRDQGYVTLVAAPLIARSERLGILAVASKEPGLDSGANLTLLRDVADHIAGAIGLMQAHQKTLAIANRQAVIARIAEVLSAVDNLPEAFDRISLEIASLLPFDRIAMTLLDATGESFEQMLVHGESATGAPSHQMLPLKGSFTEMALAGRSGVIADAGEVSKLAANGRDLARILVSERYLSYMAVPMVCGNRAVGALHLDSKEAGRYSDEALDTLREVGDHIAGAVAQHMANRMARETAQTQSELAALGRTLTKSLDLEVMLNDVAPHMKALLPSGGLIVTLLNDDGETFRVRHVYGAAIDLKSMQSRDLRRSITERAIRTKQAVALDDELAMPARERTLDMDEIALFGVKSGLAAPLIVGDQAMGAMIWVDKEPGRFTGPSADIALTIAWQFAGAIANSELYRRTLQLADETEQRLRLEDENERLETANEMKEQIISNVSHELRTPLTSMLAFADVLHRNKGGNLTAEQVAQANIIRRGGRQLELIINDLLTVSRLNAGSFNLVVSQFDVNSIVKNVARMMQPVAIGREQRIETVSGPGVGTMSGDPGRVAQALCNLVSNASRYSPTGTKITIETAMEGDTVAISVTDEGPGIPDSLRDTIFDRRFRIDNDTTRAQVGAGLGLHIARSLVNAHHGTITVDSREGEGARFTVRIPPLADAPGMAQAG